MSLTDIERAIEQLSFEDRAKLAAWLLGKILKDDSANLYSIRRRDDHLKHIGADLTGDEWDKFERDIVEAFERIP